jgi:hypothetical protein
VGARLHLRLTDAQKTRWQSLAQARGLTLTAFVSEAVEGSAIPQAISSEIEFQLQRVPSEIARILQDDALLESVLQPLVDRQLAGFDPEAFRFELLRQVREEVTRLLSAQIRSQESYEYDPA